MSIDPADPILDPDLDHHVPPSMRRKSFHSKSEACTCRLMPSRMKIAKRKAASIPPFSSTAHDKEIMLYPVCAPFAVEV